MFKQSNTALADTEHSICHFSHTAHSSSPSIFLYDSEATEVAASCQPVMENHWHSAFFLYNVQAD